MDPRQRRTHVPLAYARPAVTATPSPWLLLAAVYRAGHGVRFYANGDPTGPEIPTTFDDPGFTVGAAQVGNWDKEVRTFHGSVDELGLLARAMTDDEVRHLYDASKP